ncbi:MAG: FkbM family methyltransferase [Bacteroidetes bacterium]|nr:MAG: FkbM family methyltransferase [Bacteroidota bacterium]
MNILAKIINSIEFRLKYYFKHKGRRNELKNTIAAKLSIAEIDSLELLQICKAESIDVKCIYDIGANIGTWAMLAKAVFPSASFECFEPLNLHFSDFEKNTKLLQYIHLHKVALGNTNAFLNLNITSQSDSSSILQLTKLQTDVFGINKIKESRVEVVILDDYILKHNIAYPDLMKLDVQGFELETLKGAKKCMAYCKFIILEVSFVEFYVGQPLFEEVINFMFENNFKVVSFGFNTATGIKISQTDILFRNKNI